MIDIEKPGVKSAQEPVDEKQEKDLANTENISGLISAEISARMLTRAAPASRGKRPNLRTGPRRFRIPAGLSSYPSAPSQLNLRVTVVRTPGTGRASQSPPR